ncbi:hypothetical protein MKEN_00636300 [Mycena kentingensis (nom. inval.)]|nr:hypothetical protein MKEN_00636300 [Mycena kentingensis (nom. inval.)]
MPHDAYESDTGDRDIPDAVHFTSNTPIERKIVLPGKKALNRRGRAICRIMWKHGWSALRIGRIFGVSCTTVDHALAEYRQYYPNDEPENDYFYAGEEYQKAFPEADVDSEGEKWRKRKREEEKKQKQTLSTGRKVFKKPRYAVLADDLASSRRRDSFLDESDAYSRSPSPDAHPPVQRQKAQSTPAVVPSVSLREFLNNTLVLPSALTTPAHIVLFTTIGLSSPSRWHALARAPWAAQLDDALPRLLRSAPASAAIDLAAVDIHILVMSVQRLPRSLPSTHTTTSTPTTSLKAFLRTLPTGIDLSAHTSLFKTQGFTLPRLRFLARGYAGVQCPARRAELQRVIADGLSVGSALVPPGMGLDPLEAMALELALTTG